MEVQIKEIDTKLAIARVPVGGGLAWREKDFEERRRCRLDRKK